MKLRKALAVIGVGVALFAASDAMTYAATGSSLIMGKINTATSATTIQNKSTGSALRLITKSTTTPPMVVNGKGKVVNLYADRAATAGNATKLGGQTITQVRSGINASMVGGKTVAQIVSSATPRVAGVIWVAKSGGQFTSVKAALASITDNGAAHPYVIRIAPGTYVETTPIDVKDFVDIEGSAQNTTTITCACGSSTEPYYDGSSAALRADGATLHSEIRNLTLANTGANTYSTAVWTHSTAAGQFSLRDVTIMTTGTGFNYGIVNSSSSPTMTDITATASDGTHNYAVVSYSSSPTMINVTATATGNDLDTFAVYNNASSTTMINVTATASGTGGNKWAVANSSSTTTMTNVTATASGGTFNYGVWISSGSTLIRDSSVGGTTNSVYRNSGTIRILNTVFDGDTNNVGAAACVGGLTTLWTDYTCL